VPKADKRDFKTMSEHFCDLQGFLLFSTTSDVPSENDVGFFKKFLIQKFEKMKLLQRTKKEAKR